MYHSFAGAARSLSTMRRCLLYTDCTLEFNELANLSPTIFNDCACYECNNVSYYTQNSMDKNRNQCVYFESSSICFHSSDS